MCLENQEVKKIVCLPFCESYFLFLCTFSINVQQSVSVQQKATNFNVLWNVILKQRCFLPVSQNICTFIHYTNMTDTTTENFWRTFHHDGKISPGRWWWGIHAHVHYVTFMFSKLYALELLRCVQQRFVTLRHVTFTLCCFTLCSNIHLRMDHCAADGGHLVLLLRRQRRPAGVPVRQVPQVGQQTEKEVDGWNKDTK